MAKSDSLDKIDSALFNVMRIAKRPAYWDEFQRKADVQIDRPAAAILMMLSLHPLQFQEVVSRLGVEAPSISRKVHELEHQGLIRRQPTEDKRVHMLALSAEGSAIAAKIKNARRELLSEILSDWSVADTEQLSELMARLAQEYKTRYGAVKLNQDGDK